MANPFLDFGDDGGDENDAALNPFLLQDGEDVGNNFVAAPGTNPFAFGDDTETAEITDSAAPTTVSDLFGINQDHEEDDVAMSFFGTTIQDDDSLSVGSKTSQQDVLNEAEHRKGPPPRPAPPPSITTQDLISEVAGHLDQASSEMLDRIPVTRTPSPVSMRDLHSPSPTPDAVEDLLDVSEPQPDLMGDSNDNLFGATTAGSNIQGGAPEIPAGKGQPPRPPPPRPAAPPRPPAPPIVAGVAHVVPAAVSQQSDEGDLFDMFGTAPPPKPPPPKTKEDILSLYSQSELEEKTDLFSEEIVQDKAESQPEISSEPLVSTIISEPDQQPSTRKNSINIMQPVMDNIAPEVTTKRAPTPDIEITTVPDLPRSDDEEEMEAPKEIIESDKNESDFSPPTDSNVTTQALPGSPVEETIQINDTEQMDTGLDFVQPSGTSSANPFASPDEEESTYPHAEVTNIFANDPVPVVTNMHVSSMPATNIFGNQVPVANGIQPNTATNIFAATDEFDAFSAKFDSVKKDPIGAFDDGFGSVSPIPPGDAWGETVSFNATSSGFNDGDGFGEDDGFASMPADPATHRRRESRDSDQRDFNVVIRDQGGNLPHKMAPAIAPPPPTRNTYDPRANPFDKSAEEIPATMPPSDLNFAKRSDSQESPQTPLFDDDVSQPLEDFPRVNYSGPGWDMQLRQPNKKKITGQRFWKKIYVRVVCQGDVPVIQLLNQANDKTPFQELPLQPSYSVSDISAQQYDQFGKIFTIKLQYIFYKERAGIRPGQVTKAERITNKLSLFAKYAIEGDYAGVKEFGSDLKKLGLPVEHAPQTTELFKVGSMSFEDLKQFSICIEEALFKLTAHRDRALTYKMEEVQVTTVDEFYVEQDYDGRVDKQIARVRLFFLAFLTGMPTIELGVNDMWRQGKEVVGRHDIIPVATEEWIRLEGVEFHNVVQQDEYERSRIIKFQPPDAMYIELLRFRIRPPKNRELPLQLKASWTVNGNRVELKADVLVPGFASRKLGQIPCEDVSIRFPIPECWIYLFRVEKHFRYGSVKSAHRRTGKIKGIERILGTVDTLQESLIEVTSGQAKYEHQHRAIVWRCPRLPKEGQGAYTTHQLVCRMALTSFDQIPEKLAPHAYVEFTMPATQVSHTTVRSVSVQESDSDEPPEKYVKYLARHEYRVGIETIHGESQNAYLSATKVIKEEPPPQPPVPTTPMAPSDSDSDSN